MIISPLLIILAAAGIGALLMAFFFRRGGHILLGAGIGAVGGALGTLLFMVPLNFCTFETERSNYDIAFGLILIGTGMLLSLYALGWVAQRWIHSGNLAAIFSSGTQPTQGTFKSRLMPLVLLAPTLIILLMFLYYPSLDTVRLSSLLARLDSPGRTAFVCVDNFTRLVEPGSSNRDFINSFVNTVAMSLAIVIIGLSLSLFIATMAYLPIRGAAIYRTLLVWPYAISPAIAGIIFLLMFNPTGGIINHFTRDLLGLSIGWTNDPDVAPWTIIIASIWKSMGFNVLFYIAGLQNVPKDLLEAGSIDGANVLKRFWYIVIPLLSPITFFLIVTNTTYAFFDTFGTIDYLTPGGGPLQSTTTMMYRVYQTGIQNSDLGKAAAQAIVLFLMVIALTVIQFRSSGRQVTYGA